MPGGDWIIDVFGQEPDPVALLNMRRDVQDLVTAFGTAEGALSAMRVQAMRGAPNAAMLPADADRYKRMEAARDDALTKLRDLSVRFYGPLQPRNVQSFEAAITAAQVILSRAAAGMETAALAGEGDRGRVRDLTGDAGAALIALAWVFAELPRALRILEVGEAIRRRALDL